MNMLVNFKDNDKWGYYNSKTHKTIPAQFKYDSDFVGGYAIVCLYSSSRYGVIDETGSEVLPFIFSNIERQENGLFKAGSYYFNCLYNNKGEIVDDNGIALDQRFQGYDVIKPFGKDMYLYKAGKASGVLYYDKVIVEREDDYYYYVEIEQYPTVFKLKDNTGKFHYYDYRGRQILPEAQELVTISNNYIIFYAGYGKGKGIANAKGEILLPANYDEITYIGDNLFALIYKEEHVKYNAELNCFVVKEGKNEVSVPNTMEWCGDFKKELAIIAINHCYGVIDNKFHICVPCNYEEVKLGYKTIIIIKDQNKYHLLDYLSGDRKATYDDISYLGDNYYLFKKDGFYGVMDHNGTTIIHANFNEDIELLEEGRFKVSKGYTNINYCYFDAESHIIITTSKGMFRLPQEITWINNFSEGLAIVENAKGLKGVINEQGEFVIPCRFKGNLSDFHNGLSTISISISQYSNDIYSCQINVKGNFVIPDECKSEVAGDYQLVLQSKIRGYFAYNGKWGAIDEKGNEIIPLQFDRIEDFHGFFKVRKGNSIGILDKNGFSGDYYGILGIDGQEILPCKYPRIELNTNGLFEIIKTGVYGAKDEVLLTINQNGKLITNAKGTIIELPQVYDCVRDFEGKYAKVKKTELWGLIDEGGNLIIDCKYTSVGSENNGYIDCFVGNDAYLVSLTNDDLISLPSCKSAIYYNDNCIVLNSTKIVTKEGAILFDDYQTTIGVFQNGYAIVERNNYRQLRYGLISENGKIVIPCEYGAINFFPDLLVAEVTEPAIRDWIAVNSKFLNVDNVPVLVGGGKQFVLPSQYAMGGEYVNGLAKVAIDSGVTKNLDRLSWERKAKKGESSLSSIDDIIELLFAEEDGIKHYLWGFINENCQEIIPCIYDDVEDFRDGFSIVEKDMKRGIISLEGGMCAPIEYDKLEYLSSKMFKAKKDNKYGIIDCYGNIIIPFIYNDISSPSENLIAVQINKDGHSKDERVWGYINLQNEVVIDPRYVEAKDFSDGLAVAKDDIWKVINNKGDVILEFPYATAIDNFVDGKSQITMQSEKNSIKHTLLKNGNIIVGEQEIEIDLKSISFIGDFHYGFAKVCINNGTNRKWGFINKQGIIVISDIPNEVSDFNNGIAVYSFRDYGTQYIDAEGNLIYKDNNNIIHFDSQYLAVKKLFENRFAVTRKSDCLSAVIDRIGTVIIPFSRCNFSYTKKTDSCYINEDYKHITNEYIECNHSIYYDIYGNRIIPDPMKHVVISSIYGQTRNHFSEGLAAVSNKEGLWGFVNKDGQEQIPCNYDEVHDFNDGYCVVREGNSLCLIDKTDKLILSGDFQRIEVCDNDIFIVIHDWFNHELAYETTDDYGSPTTEYETIYDERKFNKSGEIVIPFRNKLIAIPKEYEWCDDEFHEGFLSVYKNGKWGVVNTRLELVVECIYNERFRFEDGIAIAKSGQETVVLNTFHTLFWGDYTNIIRYKEYDIFVCESKQNFYDVYNGFGTLLFSYSDINSRLIRRTSKKYIRTDLIPIDYNIFKFYVSGYYEGKRISKWGLCGINGELILEACFETIGGVGSGLISVAKSIYENGCEKQLWGYVDMRGNIVVDFKYAKARPFSKGMAQVQKEEYGKWGIISTDGKELTDFVYEKLSEHSSGDMLCYYQNHKKTPVLITEQGAIHYQYCIEERYDRDVFLMGYDWCSDIYHGLCIVIKGNCYGIIEESGELTFPLSEMGHVKIAPNKNRDVCFKKWDEYKSITKCGQIITCLDKMVVELPVGIHWCDEWIDGYIAVESNNKWGLLNVNLEYVLETKYDSVQYIGNKRVLCKENEEDRYTIFCIETGERIPLPYNECSRFANGCAIVSKVIKEFKQTWTNEVHRDYVYGLIDNTGQELLPCNYTQIQFKKPIKIENINNNYYEEPYDWKSDYRDAFEDEPGAYWGREG